MPDVENRTSLETLEETITPPNDSAEEEPTTKNTPSVMLLFRIGEALQAAKKTHDGLSLKRKPAGFLDNDAKAKGGIASFVHLVQSINEDENQLDFAAAMDWLERESNTGNSLIINLTRPGDDDSSSDDSSTSSEHNSEDSDYMEGGGDSKPRHKKRTSHNKQKNLDEGDCPPNGNTNLNILSSVCGVANEIKSDDVEEEISVNESNESNNNLPDYLLNVLYGKSTHHDEVDDDGVQDGQQHRDKSGGLEERQDSDKDDKVEDDGVQDGQQHRDKSSELEETQDSDEDDEDEDEGVQHGQQHQDKVVDLRRGKILKKNNKITGLARLGKTLCLKVKGNDCRKRRGIERGETGTGKRTRRVIMNPKETTKKKTQQRRSINEERNRKKGRRSHQMVFEFTFYTYSV